MLAIVDTFNGSVISCHRTLETAAKAELKFWRQFYRNNSSNSYLPLELRAWNPKTRETSSLDPDLLDDYRDLKDRLAGHR